VSDEIQHYNRFGLERRARILQQLKPTRKRRSGSKVGGSGLSTLQSIRAVN
jgi:hypothetical protein